MPEIQELYPPGDVDEDYRFVVAMDHTITPEVLSAASLRFTFRGPFNVASPAPTTWVEASGGGEVQITDLRRKEVTCVVSGLTLPSGEFRGVLRKVNLGDRATLARWRMQVRRDHVNP